MASEIWVPLNLALYTSEKTGEVFLLPTQSDLSMMEERVEEINQEISEQKNKDQIKALEVLKERTISNIKKIRDQTEELQSKSEKRIYYLRVPTLGEFNEAEEAAKDWVGGEPRVNESRLGELLMSGHIKFGNDVLSTSDIKGLDMQVGRKLWEELKRLMMPNTQRLPFLK